MLLLLLACSNAAAPDVAPTPTATPTVAAAPRTPTAAVRDVDVPTLRADLDRATVPLLVDVRTPEEYASGHVPGARNVPIDQLETRLAEFGTPASEVYVICESGGRSARASITLAGKGLHPVNVIGGTAAWRAAGLPVE